MTSLAYCGCLSCLPANGFMCASDKRVHTAATDETDLELLFKEGVQSPGGYRARAWEQWPNARDMHAASLAP